MNTSRKLLKADKNIQSVMLSAQLILVLVAYVFNNGGYGFWVPIITLFLGIYQLGISGFIHITELRYTAEPIKKWRRIHMAGSVLYLITAITICTMYRSFSVFFIALVIIPQLIGYAYYALTIWDERLYRKYVTNLTY